MSAAAPSAKAGPAVDAAIDPAVVRDALGSIPDPELPVISIVDLGIVRSIAVTEKAIRVELLPTFLGCPAVDLIVAAVTERLASLAPGFAAEVVVSHAEPWSTDRITPNGRSALRRSGIGPPLPLTSPISLADRVSCPYCGSRRTVLDSAFGPTPCRSIRYCTACRQPFEQMKSI